MGPFEGGLQQASDDQQFPVSQPDIDPIADLQARAARVRQLPVDPQQSALLRAHLGLPDPVEQQPIQQQPPVVDLQLEALKRRFYSNIQQLNQPPRGGVRAVLSRFLTAGGNAMMKEAGIPTEEDLQQRALQNLLSIKQVETMEGYRRSQEAMNQLVPRQMPDGSTVMLPQAHVATFDASMARIMAAPDRIINAQQEYTNAAGAAIAAGRDPAADPKTQQWLRVIQAAQKPEKPAGTKTITRIVKGVPHSILVDEYTGEDVRDEGPTKVEGAAGADVTTRRADKSYEFQSKRIDNLRKPISDRMVRIDNLETTLSQNTPQADALVAPELLTAMAGGMGSGLRMNEAEIARIVGGRSNWESLKATLNKWQADPSKALSITPAQRSQMMSLVREVKRRAHAQLSAIDEADSQLLGSDDPKEHRRVVNDLHKKLGADDLLNTQQSQTDTTSQPANDPFAAFGGRARPQ